MVLVLTRGVIVIVVIVVINVMLVLVIIVSVVITVVNVAGDMVGTMDKVENGTLLSTTRTCNVNKYYPIVSFLL